MLKKVFVVYSENSAELCGKVGCNPTLIEGVFETKEKSIECFEEVFNLLKEDEYVVVEKLDNYCRMAFQEDDNEKYVSINISEETLK